jgi:hypothetical protein
MIFANHNRPFSHHPFPPSSNEPTHTSTTLSPFNCLILLCLPVLLSIMESLMYKTPSPVTAKRRLSAIPVPRSTTGRVERVASEQVQRIQREWPGLHNERSRRDSLGSRNDLLTTLREEADSVDSSMGFRELERVHSFLTDGG